MCENVMIFYEVRQAVACWLNAKMPWLNAQGILLTVQKDEEKSLVVYFNFGECMASLVVTAGEYAPYRFVGFEAVTMMNVRAEVFFAWYDDENTSVAEVLVQLDKAIDYVYEFNKTLMS
jgi:hypothetical protein